MVSTRQLRKQKQRKHKRDYQRQLKIQKQKDSKKSNCKSQKLSQSMQTTQQVETPMICGYSNELFHNITLQKRNVNHNFLETSTQSYNLNSLITIIIVNLNLAQSQSVCMRYQQIIALPTYCIL